MKGAQKETTNPITYDKQQVPSQKICHRNFIETDIRGFGTKVGTYSNYSTIIEAMLPMFQREDQARQREELLMRKQLLREINGQEIDRIKGVDAEGPPKDDWLKFWPIDPDDDDITKEEKYYHNSLVISKKPYFFRYLYPELNQRYKQYENAYNEKAKFLFGIKLKKLLSKPDKSEEEKTLVKRYHKFSPLINTNCIMNTLCREFEDIDFDINYDKNCVSALPYIEDYKCDASILKKVKSMYQKWNNRKSCALANSIYDDTESEECREVRMSIIDSILDDVKKDCDELELTPIEVLTYVHELAKSYSKFNYSFAWDILDEKILSCIDEQDALAPVEGFGGSEYLGRYYSLITIPKEKKNYRIDEETGEVFFDNENGGNENGD